MNPFDLQHLLALLNFSACLLIGYLCICRLNTAKARDYLAARARYTLLLGGACASGLQPMLWGEWPSAADTAMTLCVAAWLAIQSLHLAARADGRARRSTDHKPAQKGAPPDGIF